MKNVLGRTLLLMATTALAICLPAMPMGMALGRTVKDELLMATQMLRASGEDDQAYWKRVVSKILEMGESASSKLSAEANEYLKQFKDDDGKTREGIFDVGSPSIQTPDDYNDALLMRLTGGGQTSAPGGVGAINTPLANLGVGARVSLETKDKGTLEGHVRQNTTEFLAIELSDGTEEVVRAMDVTGHTVLDDGTGTTQVAGDARRGTQTPNTAGDATRRREKGGTARAAGGEEASRAAAGSQASKSSADTDKKA